MQISTDTFKVLMAEPFPSLPEPREGDKAGQDTEFINPASEAGQAYIEELNESFGERAATSILGDDVGPIVLEQPQDDAHKELTCAIEGPCEISNEAKMFSTPEEDFEAKKQTYHEEMLQKALRNRLIYRAEEVEEMILDAKEQVLKDLKFNLGHNMLMNLLGNPKPKSQKTFEMEELLEECVPLSKTLADTLEEEIPPRRVDSFTRIS